MAGDVGNGDRAERSENRKDGLTRRQMCTAAVVGGVGVTAGVSSETETHTLTVVGQTDGPTTYEAATDGQFETGARAVEDALADDRHEYRFEGSLTYLTVRGGPAVVFLDGSRIEPAVVGG